MKQKEGGRPGVPPSGFLKWVVNEKSRAASF